MSAIARGSAVAQPALVAAVDMVLDQLWVDHLTPRKPVQTITVGEFREATFLFTRLLGRVACPASSEGRQSPKRRASADSKLQLPIEVRLFTPERSSEMTCCRCSFRR